MVTQGTQPQGASLGDLGDGGGLLTIIGGKYEYKPYTAPDQTVTNNLQATMKMRSEGGKEFDWGLNVGTADNWQPSADGMEALPLRDGGKISKQSGFGFFLQEMQNAGFPSNRLTTRLDCLFGVVFESHNLAPSGKTQGGEDRKPVMVPKAVVSLPGESVGAGVSVNGNTNASAPPSVSAPAPPTVPPTVPITVPQVPAPPITPPPAPPTTPQAMDNTVDALVMEIVADMGNSFGLSDVMSKIAAKYSDNTAVRDGLMGHVFSEEFKATLTGAGFSVDEAGNVSKG